MTTDMFNQDNTMQEIRLGTDLQEARIIYQHLMQICVHLQYKLWVLNCFFFGNDAFGKWGTSDNVSLLSGDRQIFFVKNALQNN